MKIRIKCSYTELEPIGQLQPNPANPNTHPEEQVDKLAKLIELHGWRLPIIVSKRSGLIVAGHGRLLAAQKLGMKTVPVDFQHFKDDAEEMAVMISDNVVADLSVFDGLKMAEILNELDTFNVDLSAFTALEKEQIEDYIVGPTEPPGGLTDPDAVPTDVPAKTKTGDIWLLGDHRVMCGDSLRSGDVGRLMGDVRAAMVFTDPPYNVDYGISKNPRHKIRTIEGDKQTSQQWEIFCRALFEQFKKHNKGDIYLWSASAPEGMKMRLWLVEMGCHWSATIVWKKQQLVLSPANYQRIYEPCFYGWFNKSSFCADRKQTEVWEFDRPLDSKLHPTMKPVDMCSYGISNSSKPGDVVLDLFLGSGSTIIACEQTNRTCYGMEIDPAYCDVIVRRWEDYTGKKAKLEKPKKRKRNE